MCLFSVVRIETGVKTIAGACVTIAVKNIGLVPCSTGLETLGIRPLNNAAPIAAMYPRSTNFELLVWVRESIKLRPRNCSFLKYH